MRSFANFLILRRSMNAQKEIMHIADEMLNLVRQTSKFKYTLEAFGY
jgi:thymidylate synthase ThyX